MTLITVLENVVRIDCRALKDGGDYHAAVDVQAYTALKF